MDKESHHRTHEGHKETARVSVSTEYKTWNEARLQRAMAIFLNAYILRVHHTAPIKNTME